MRESTFTEKCKDWLESIGCKVVPLVASRMSPPGLNDRLVIHRDWMGLIEFKGTNTPWEKHQKAFHKESLRKRAGCSVCLRPNEDGSLIYINDELQANNMKEVWEWLKQQSNS